MLKAQVFAADWQATVAGKKNSPQESLRGTGSREVRNGFEAGVLWRITAWRNDVGRGAGKFVANPKQHTWSIYGAGAQNLRIRVFLVHPKTKDLSMIERLRSPGFKAHRMFVADIKEAFRQFHGSGLDPAKISPRILGKQPLGFQAPSMMEKVFGYGGNLRFVEFSFVPRPRQFGCSDGGDRLISDEKLWLEFVNHPVVARELGEERYPSLYGIFKPNDRGRGREWHKASGLATQADGERHCVILDRHQRLAYVFTWFEAVMFFPLTEPEEGDDHTVFNGKVLSRGCENWVPSMEAANEFRDWLRGKRVCAKAEKLSERIATGRAGGKAGAMPRPLRVFPI